MEPVYKSAAARCPASGHDIFFTWDVRSGALRALVGAGMAPRQQAVLDAGKWCSSFNLHGKHFDTLHEASRYVERYDTWFPVA